MSYTFFLEIESSVSKEEFITLFSHLVGVKAHDDIFVIDNLWLRVGAPDDLTEIDCLDGIVPDILLLIREQPVKDKDMKYILSIISKMLEINSWNAVLIDEQPKPVFIYKDKLFSWDQQWYNDLVNVMPKYMKKNI